MYKFSVIIPCYHSEEFIGKAIKSVQVQSFADYELLVMCEADDLETIEAVEECGVVPYVEAYGSSGAARNAGIEKAAGEYILFLDSDDWYLHSECFAMLNQFLRFPADILSFAFIFGTYGYTSTLGNNGHLYPNVWSRVWRKSFIDKYTLRFPDVSRDEDIVFVQDALGKNPQHRMTDIPFVYYTYPREGSRMSEKERDENG